MKSYQSLLAGNAKTNKFISEIFKLSKKKREMIEQHRKIELHRNSEIRKNKKWVEKIISSCVDSERKNIRNLELPGIEILIKEYYSSFLCIKECYEANGDTTDCLESLRIFYRVKSARKSNSKID